jgi:coiled-coil domain-containing protein 12
MADVAGVGILEQQAQQRQAKLKALREKKSDQKGGTEEGKKPKLKFRSYNPQTEELKEKKLPKGRPENVEPQIQEQLEAAKSTDLGDINLANLAPKKVDWDLKRDIAKKLDKLERRTQRAVVELICERLQGEEEKEGDLESAVATTGREQLPDDDSD